MEMTANRILDGKATAQAVRPAAAGFLVQLRPDLLAGLPHRLAETLAGELQRHHEQVRTTVLARGRPGRRTEPVVDLRFLTGRELQDVEALRGVEAALVRRRILRGSRAGCRYVGDGS